MKFESKRVEPVALRRAGQPNAPKDYLYRAIADQCIECMGGEAEPRVRWEVGNCTALLCMLKPYRPYQHLIDAPMPKEEGEVYV